MIWEDKLVFITRHGPIFYAALGSVALGLTLMLVSIFVSLRRLPIGRSKAPWRSLGRLFRLDRRRSGNGEAARVQATDIGYQANTPGIAAAAVSPSAPVADYTKMADLLARLKVAADRLEALAQAEQDEYGFEPISSLKGMGSAVEYLQKTQAI